MRVGVPGHPSCDDLVAAWEETKPDVVRSGEMQIGGYGDEEDVEVDPVDTCVRTALYAAEPGRWKWPVSAAPPAGYRSPTGTPPASDIAKGPPFTG